MPSGTSTPIFIRREAKLEDLRILLLSDYSDGSGGVERLLGNHRYELRRQGHTVSWLSSSVGTPEADRLCFGTTGKLRGLVQLANPMAAGALRRAIAEFRPDVVHVGMFLTQLSPSILPVLAEVPSVYHAQWYRPICLTGTRVLPDGRACPYRAGAACLRERCVPAQDWLPLAWGLQRFRERKSAFRLIVANSGYVQKALGEWGCEAPMVIPCGVETRPQRPALSGPPTAVFAGRLVREKGAHILVEAARALPEAGFVIAGEGPERMALEALAGPNVEFTGHLSREAMEARFGGAWVQVVPSLWQEPFGLTAAEAQMRGTAVVASAVGGLAEVIRHGLTGLAVPAGDVGAWVAALRTLLTNREAAERMGQAGRAHAEAELGMEKFTRRFIEAYRSILG